MNVKITDLGFAVQIAEGEALFDLFGTPGNYFYSLPYNLYAFFRKVIWLPNFFVARSLRIRLGTAFRLIYGRVGLSSTPFSVACRPSGIGNNTSCFE